VKLEQAEHVLEMYQEPAAYSHIAMIVLWIIAL
jgi:hypothetical protein